MTPSTQREVIRHRDDCPTPDAPPERFTGWQGDTLEKCLGCQRFCVVTIPPPSTPQRGTKGSVVGCAICGVMLAHRGTRPVVRLCRDCTKARAKKQPPTHRSDYGPLDMRSLRTSLMQTINNQEDR